MSIDLIRHGYNTKGVNEFHDYELNMSISDENKINELASELSKYYIKTQELQLSLPDDFPFNTILLKRFINSRVPHWVDGRENRLQVVRSEFGEIIAQMTLKKIFKTHIPLNRLQHKEKPLLPTRGIDLIGVEFENETPILILGEAKVSGQNKTPPQVVRSSKEDCLEKRMPYLLTTKDEVIEELAYYTDHCTKSEDKKLFLSMMKNYIDSPDEVIVVGVPFLVRSISTYSVEDSGNLLNFKCNGKFCSPCNNCNNKRIRFIRLRVENVDALSKKIYNVARGGI